MKRILIFSTAYYPFVGGAEVAVKEITDRLGEDFEFDLIMARMKKLPKQEKIGNINIYRVGLGIKKLDKYLLAFFGHRLGMKLNKAKPYDSVWAIMASYGGFAAIYFKRGNKNIPFLLTLQEGDDPAYIKKRVGIFHKLFLQIFKSADYIQTISKFLAGWAKENGAECPIEIVPNGVDLEKFICPESFNQEEAKKSLNFSENDKLIITTSRLTRKNGLDSLVRSLSMTRINPKLLILGEGEEEENLKKIARELKIENSIYFLGYQKHDDLVKYLWASDLFVRPSLSEGLGNSFLEAMAAGLPIIGTPVGGIPDFLVDGETGLFCEPNNPEDLARKIDRVFSDDALRQLLVKNGKELVVKNYDWDKIARKMKNILERLIK
ncbi:MAG: glycosyltransferase family 4 protein [Patescibacteria group bacterium]|nr:glycosyltransferase family 4 protein [Patescibacteria group bacterium]MDD4611083.1 glycosyltransferase family 4 protein [Patescibacteria group bacterium]